MTRFSKKKKKKNSQSDLDLEPRTLKVEFARDIIIPNICVKLYEKPSINVGARAMTKGGHTYVLTCGTNPISPRHFVVRGYK